VPQSPGTSNVSSSRRHSTFYLRTRPRPRPNGAYRAGAALSSAPGDRLTPEQRRRFRKTVTAFVEDLRTGRFRAGLRIKGVQRAPGVYELTWSMGTGPAGRATWEYGAPIVPGEQHIVWRRIGTHDILSSP